MLQMFELHYALNSYVCQTSLEWKSDTRTDDSSRVGRFSDSKANQISNVRL